jgi:FkbM family methyltransferase
VGANNGLFSVAYCLAHPLNRAVAFEPSPPLVERIRQMARLNEIEAASQSSPKAVGESAGELAVELAKRGGFVQVESFAGTAHNEWKASPSRQRRSISSRRAAIADDPEGRRGRIRIGSASRRRVDDSVGPAPTIFLEVT